jgi:hypothetical protein
VFSKLQRHVGSPPVSLLPEPQPAELAQALGAPLDCLQTVGGGTSGFCYTARVAGRALFLKTHATTENAARLRQEATLLDVLHGPEMGVRQLVTAPPARDWLVCDQLPELGAKLSPTDLAAVVADYQQRFARAANRVDALPLPDFEDLLDAGISALGGLARQSLLNRELEHWLAEALEGLREAAPRLPRVICHGDLGPLNLLQLGSRPVAIDWEDACRGIQGYDQLYWLSFMENARWMRDGWASLTTLPPALERGLLGVIVLLKSHLALASGAYRQHRVPLAERLGEIAGLPLPTRPANAEPA